MIMRRAETDPNKAISQLTRDIARLRGDLDNIRSALTSRGRQMLHDARDQMGATTSSAARHTTAYVRSHPAGVAMGVAAVAAVAVALAVVIGRMQR